MAAFPLQSCFHYNSDSLLDQCFQDALLQLRNHDKRPRRCKLVKYPVWELELIMLGHWHNRIRWDPCCSPSLGSRLPRSWNAQKRRPNQPNQSFATSSTIPGRSRVRQGSQHWSWKCIWFRVGRCHLCSPHRLTSTIRSFRGFWREGHKTCGTRDHWFAQNGSKSSNHQEDSHNFLSRRHPAI